MRPRLETSLRIAKEQTRSNTRGVLTVTKACESAWPGEACPNRDWWRAVIHHLALTGQRRAYLVEGLRGGKPARVVTPLDQETLFYALKQSKGCSTGRGQPGWRALSIRPARFEELSHALRYGPSELQEVEHRV